MTDFSNEELVTKLMDAEKKIKELEDYKRHNYITAIKRFGDKYADEELETKDLKELEIIYDAGCRFYDDVTDPENKPDTLPMGVKMNKKTGEPNLRIDFSKVFDDVSKEFNMDNIKIKNE